MTLVKLIKKSFLIALLYNPFSSVLAEAPLERQLRIGFDVSALPDVIRADLEVSMQLWAEEISRAADVPVTVRLYENQDQQMVTDFQTGATNFLFASPLQFLEQFDKSSLADGFTAIPEGMHFDSLVLLTLKGKNLDRLDQLKNKHVSTLKAIPFHTIYLQTLCLRTFKQDCTRQLFVNQQEKNSNRLILRLFFQQTDAVVVSKSAFNIASEMNPQLLDAIQVVAELNDIPMSVGYFNASVELEFREEVITKAISMKQYPRGEAMLRVFNTDTVVRSKLSDLDAVERLLREFQALSGKH